MTKLLLGLLFVAATLVGPADGAEEKGYFGFKLAVETSGFALNPTLKFVKVKSVAPNSPAAAQHLAVGDEIIEAEGRAVPGGRALELRPMTRKRPGETVHLRLKRGNGETYSAAITAIKKPS